MKMFNKTYLIPFLYLFFSLSTLTAQVNLEWVQTAGTMNSNSAGIAACTDTLGDIITVGSFRDSISFATSGSATTLISNGQNDNFVLKLDANGNALWAISYGGSTVDQVMDVATDATGNIYLLGTFQVATDFDPGVGLAILDPVLGSDIYVLKLDPNGAFLWVKEFGNDLHSYPEDLDVDPLGNVHIVGSINDTVDFDPGIGVVNLGTAAIGNDLFMVKLNANGEYVWAHSIPRTVAKGIHYQEGFLYISGHYASSIDLDPGAGVAMFPPVGSSVNAFILKLDTSSNYVWAKTIGGSGFLLPGSIKAAPNGDVVVTGRYQGTADFDPSASGVTNLTAVGLEDIYVVRLNTNGAFKWAKSMGGAEQDVSSSIEVDAEGNVFVGGSFRGMADFDPSVGTYPLSSNGAGDLFVQKLDSSGALQWLVSGGDIYGDLANRVVVDRNGGVFITGAFYGTIDFDPTTSIYNGVNSGGTGLFFWKLGQRKIYGSVYHDFSQNCIQDGNELGLEGRLLEINPGNIMVTTNEHGVWSLDSLPIGNYTVTLDTMSNHWIPTCPITQPLIITGTSSSIQHPNFGLISTTPCADPRVSLSSLAFRPGLTQRIHVQVCNGIWGTDYIDSTSVLVELDSLLTIQGASVPYTTLGNNLIEVEIDSVFPGACTTFWLDCSLSLTALMGQTICMKASLAPIDSCFLDESPDPFSDGEISPCTLPWDNSSLLVEGHCLNDSIRFCIYNTGDLVGGDMDCFAPVRVFVDGQQILLDSIQLAGGDSIVFMFDATGQTWRLEVDQHPLHLGNSTPNATVELCGDPANWTPNLVNVLPQDDNDPHVDIHCIQVINSQDPNDKRGFPLGVGVDHYIRPNQAIDYKIRFQNTGTAPAIDIVILDTLPMELNPFSIRLGASSDSYEFKILGPRVLEWTFKNIMLPDSNTNEPASHGFVTFKIDQLPNLVAGTQILNDAAIYFDFNAPIITNTSLHTIQENNFYLGLENTKEIELLFDVKLYPNPTTGMLHIERQENHSIQVFVSNTFGQRLLSKSINDQNEFLNLEHLPTGIYYLNFKDGKHSITRKIIKL